MSKFWLLLAVIVGASPAFATKSRLEALSQDANGSYYIKDERNIFLNPAYIHNVDRRINLEWGNAGTATKVDGFTTPKAEGGWFNGKHSMPYAAYLGNEDTQAITARNAADTAFMKPDNTFDFIWGMGTGMTNRWGFAASFSKNKDEVTGGIDRSETFAGLRAGVLLGDAWEIFGHFHLLDEADGAAADGDEYKGKMGLMAGAIYNWGQYRVYGRIDKKDAEYTPAGASGLDLTGLEITIGAGHSEELSSKSFLFYFAELSRDTNEVDTAPSTSTETETTQVLLGFGVEGQVKDWLTLRGSVNQGLLLNDTSTKTTGTPSADQSIADSTAVAGGMSINFDPFRLDGSFTTTGGTLNAGNIMSRVAMTYAY